MQNNNKFTEMMNKFLEQEDIFDPEYAEKKKKEIEKQELEIKNNKKLYNEFFNNENGIKILNDLMVKSGYFYTLLNRAQTNDGMTDQLKLAYLDGRRSLFCEIANLLHTDLLIKVKDYGTNE